MYFSTIPVAEHYVIRGERKEPEELLEDLSQFGEFEDLFAAYFELAYGDEKKAEEVLQKQAMSDDLSAVSWLLLKGAGLSLPAPEYAAPYFTLDPHLKEGMALFKAQRFEEAIHAFNASLERGVNEKAYYWRATAKAMMDNLPGAFQDYLMSEQVGVCSHDAEKAILLAWMGRLGEAREILAEIYQSQEGIDQTGALLLDAILVKWESPVEILFNNAIEKQKLGKKEKKPDINEKKVRKALVKVWTKILEKYARPGAVIPSPEAVRKELLHVGVDAGVDVVLDENWWAMSFMVRGEIEEKVKRGLNQLNFTQLIEDVRKAQHDPAMLNYLREQVKQYVLNC